MHDRETKAGTVHLLTISIRDDKKRQCITYGMFFQPPAGSTRCSYEHSMQCIRSAKWTSCKLSNHHINHTTSPHHYRCSNLGPDSSNLLLTEPDGVLNNQW